MTCTSQAIHELHVTVMKQAQPQAVRQGINPKVARTLPLTSVHLSKCICLQALLNQTYWLTWNLFGSFRAARRAAFAAAASLSRS